MKLESIIIKNYRSIEELTFNISQLEDKTYTYGLVGVNEAGKSTILKALALKDGLNNEKGEKLPLLKDFKDKTKDIEVIYFYILDQQEQDELKESLQTTLPGLDLNNLDLSNIKYTISFKQDTSNTKIEKIEIQNMEDFNEQKNSIEEQIKNYISSKSLKAIFWTAEDRYLISQPINLTEFAKNPENISIPLKNCFALAGIVGQEVIQSKINSIHDSTERELLENLLGEKVSEHIKKAWPENPIKITFNISDGLINFHVHDIGAKGKAKTADQRSDGFRQFVSFLLTISAQNENSELTNSILLLDEPETHLHPKAQEDLLKELIKITNNDRNNIVFFATHSNYMIDKKDLSRNYKIFKKAKKNTEQEKTEKEQFDKKTSTYASVTYQVFDIPSTDYHNELYGLLQDREEKYTEKDFEIFLSSKDIKIDKEYIKIKKDKSEEKYKVSLPTKIRNQIHHPENTKNGEIDPDELRKSIDLLYKIIHEN